MAGQPGRPIAASGSRAVVAYAVCTRGESPAKEFVEGLSRSDVAKIAALFQRMADLGEIKHREKFKKVEGVIWEFKCHQIRILCFRDGDTWVLTHGFLKKTDDIRRAELDRANEIRSQDLARSNRPGEGKKR